MAALSVDTTAQQVPLADGKVFIQNLGPGILYVESNPNLTTATGVQVPVNGTYFTPEALDATGGRLFVIASAPTDMRYLAVG